MIPLIFIIDDSPADVELLKQAFAECRIPARFAVCCDGIEAMVRLQTVVPDLVLVDINMPLVEGFEVLESMRAMPWLAGVPTVMMSSSCADHDRARALRCGAMRYWTKTPLFADLVARVASLAELLPASAPLAAESRG
jgi:CheY-like chemotaxis protein